MTIDRLIELSQAPSDYITNATTITNTTTITNPSTNIREGIVVKRIGFVNRFGRTVWGKIISREFLEKKTLHTHSQKHDPIEMRFAAFVVTRDLVVKTIHKVAESHGETFRVQHIGEVLGRVWYDVFQEELWDFVKKNRVQGFHFGEAQKCVTLKARDIALAYYNGLPEGFNNGQS